MTAAALLQSPENPNVMFEEPRGKGKDDAVRKEDGDAIVVMPETEAIAAPPLPADDVPWNDAVASPGGRTTRSLDGSDDDDDNDLTSRRSSSSSWIGKMLWTRHQSSLSRAPSTPCLALYLIPLFSIATHFIFLYGQSAAMWRLHLSEQVDVWANATTLESRTTLDTLGLPHHNHIFVDKEKNVREFTYMYAIQELWKAKHMPGKVLPRLAAVLLIIFSGLWPHLKLLLLNYTWLFATDGVRRTRMLHWLSTLGKWSLADVLVVCVMVGVLHLDWVVDPQATKDGLVQDLPYVLTLLKSLYSASDICTLAMKMDCHGHHKSWSKWSQCKACVALVKSAVENPKTARKSLKGFFDGMQVGGGGLVYLRVHGMSGIYVFCSAVILSIIISLIVDVFDVRAQRAAARNSGGQQVLEHELALARDGSGHHNADDDDYDGDSYEDLHTHFRYRQRLHSAGEVAYDGFMRQTEELEQYRWHKYSVWSGSGVATILVVCGVLCFSIERRVHGAIPNTLHKVLGIEWDHKYSLLSLVRVTGAAGGYDYLLMGTFGLFMVLGPLLRVFLCVLASVCPCAASSRARRILLASLEFVGAFCAWEVLVAAVGMVDLLMPSITGTVILNPDCAAISPDGSCLSVEFVLLDSFTFVILGGLALVCLANLGYGSRRTLIEAERDHQEDTAAHYHLLGRGRLPSETRLLTA